MPILHATGPRVLTIFAVVLAAMLLVLPLSTGQAEQVETTRYLVVFDATRTDDGGYALGGNDALYHEVALDIIETAGGTVVADLSQQIAVMVVESNNDLFAESLSEYALVDEVGEEFAWKQFPSREEAIASGELVLYESGETSGDEASTEEPLQSLQWGLEQIRVPVSHTVQRGVRQVAVGILDTGIDATHSEFLVGDQGSNIDLERGRDFTYLGTQSSITDNNFHGTHIAGIVAAQANGAGILGVAPGVSLVPIKVCDSSGHCYATPVVQGITYAGDIQLNVINMSFYVDDDAPLESTEFKCNDDPKQRAFRKSVERAVGYARSRGVTPIASLGNSDTNLADKEDGNNCKVVPAEVAGVVGVAALGPQSEKASYSNYGNGATDVAGPGGNGMTGNCSQSVLSSIPGASYGCFKGTSMAAPHATGVAALIISQFGKQTEDGRLVMSPQQVVQRLQSTTIDIGLKGYDECFGHGRIDALRAVLHDTSTLYNETAPFCPEYDE